MFDVESERASGARIEMKAQHVSTSVVAQPCCGISSGRAGIKPLLIRVAGVLLVCSFCAASTPVAFMPQFSSWDSMIRRSADIAVVEWEHPPLRTDFANGEAWSDVKVISVLKGSTRSGLVKLISEHVPKEGERALIFAEFQSNDLYQAYHAFEPYAVVSLGTNISIGDLTNRSLDEQIKLILRDRLADLGEGSASNTDEIARLQQWPTIQRHSRSPRVPDPQRYLDAVKEGSVAKLIALDAEIEDAWTDLPVDYFRAKIQLWKALAALAANNNATAKTEAKKISHVTLEKDCPEDPDTRQCLDQKRKFMETLAQTDGLPLEVDTARLIAASAGKVQPGMEGEADEMKRVLYEYCYKLFLQDPEAKSHQQELGKAAGLSVPETGQLGMRFF